MHPRLLGAPGRLPVLVGKLVLERFEAQATGLERQPVRVEELELALVEQLVVERLVLEHFEPRAARPKHEVMNCRSQ